MSTPADQSAPGGTGSRPAASTASTTAVPWWAHFISGGLLLAAGLVAAVFIDKTLGEGLVTVGAGFLGYGGGVASQA